MEVQSVLTRSLAFCLPFKRLLCSALLLAPLARVGAQKITADRAERGLELFRSEKPFDVPMMCQLPSLITATFLDLRIGPEALISNFFQLGSTRRYAKASAVD